MGIVAHQILETFNSGLTYTCFASKYCIYAGEIISVFMLILEKTISEDFPGGTVERNSPALHRIWVQSLVWEDSTCCTAT